MTCDYCTIRSHVVNRPPSVYTFRMNQSTSTVGVRGPADHAIRDQIVAAANEHFSHYGYAKTTVSDLAKAIGFSKAYIYKFFDSKQAIGEAICAEHCLGVIMASVDQALSTAKTATEKFRQMFGVTAQSSKELFFSDRKLYEIAAVSAAERWPSTQNYEAHIKALLLEILQQGRKNGEFERKTPIDEATRSIFLVMQPFVNPLLLQYNFDLVPEGPREITSLVLRSLAP
jgi:AcrR family transcriptional regulator